MSRADLFFTVRSLLLVSFAAWIAGGIVIAWLERRIEAFDGDALGVPEKILVSAMAMLGFSFVAMVLHIVSGGVVFGTPLPIPALVVVLFFIRRKMTSGFRLPRFPRLTRRLVAVTIMGVVFLCLYAIPVFLAGSGVRTGDPPWHLGWTEQVLAGDPVPTGPAPEFGRNAYPWGFHAVLATIVRLDPGADPLVALETVHILLIGLIPVGAACLARLVNRRAGPAAAWMAGAVGGLGWVTSGPSSFVTSPSEARYGADLVVASPNSMYELFPPALPRELALAALAGGTLLVAIAIRGADRRLLLAAGAAMGTVGLISVPLFLTAVAWTLAMCLVGTEGDRIRSSLAVVAGGVGVFALWAGPVAGNWFRYGGFVNITPQLGVEWDPGVALASWGVLLPLTIVGIGTLLVQPRILSRPLLACFAGSIVLFLIAIARARLNWAVLGNETLLHQGRMWPPLHLLAAAAGGIAFMLIFGWLRRRARALAVSFAALVGLLGIMSPVVAARGLGNVLSHKTEGFVYARMDYARGAFARRAASHLGPDDVVEVVGSDTLGFTLFQFSGVKLATYDDPRLVGNELRIRFADLAEAWNERTTGDGFEPDYIVRPASGRTAIETGAFGGTVWELVPSG